MHVVWDVPSLRAEPSRSCSLPFVCCFCIACLVSYVSASGAGERIAAATQQAIAQSELCCSAERPSSWNILALMQVFTAAVDGVIMLWQYRTAQVLAVWQVAHPIESMAVLAADSAAFSVRWGEKQRGRIALAQLTTPQTNHAHAAQNRADRDDGANAAEPMATEPPNATMSLKESNVEPPCGETRDAVPEAHTVACTNVCKLSQAGTLVASQQREYVAAVDRHQVKIVCLQQRNHVITLHHTRPLTVCSSHMLIACHMLITSSCMMA